MNRDHRLLPILATCAGIALFSIMDGLMKRASIASGVYSALLLRSLVAGLGMLPVWRLRGGRWPSGGVLRVHVLRAVVTTGMAATFFWGLVRTPMAEGIALSFIAPLIALYLAAVQLGERIRRQAIAASAFGLVGVVAIAVSRIGAMESGGVGEEAGWGIAAVLLSAVLYAWNLVLQRQQSLLASPMEVALFQNLFMAATLLPALPLLWQAPGDGVVFDIVAAAGLATGALMLLSWGYGRAEAQVLVPIEYTAFIWAALIGWLWFAEPVTSATMLGLALIIAGTWLGTRRAEPAPAESPASS
jgi:S-adenosylmethionine uptake transporter